MKIHRLKPASCMALAVVGSVALMPLASSHAQQSQALPCEVIDEEIGTRSIEVERPRDEPDPLQALGVLSPVDHGDPKPKNDDGKPASFRQQTAKAVNPAFDAKLYRLLAAQQGNIFFSPYSISEAMGMVYAGTGGNTAAEIASAISYDKDSRRTAAQLRTLREQLHRSVNKGEKNKLSIANGLCVTGRVPEQGFQTLVREQFAGELFSGGVPEINNWVKQKTDGRIESILDKLGEQSACVLLNAVYFKGKWLTPFDTEETREEPFNITADKQVSVNMMQSEDYFRVLRNDKLVALELLYETGVSMVLIMPAKAEGMKDLEQSLSASMLDGVCAELAKADHRIVKLLLPKFKIATGYDLVQPMKKLGMADAFDFEKSDFQAMYGSEKTRISQIVHKATLEVDELGSEAAAASGVGVDCLSGSIGHVDNIRFDRPFLVLIRDKESGTNLFMGRISDPTAN